MVYDIHELIRRRKISLYSGLTKQQRRLAIKNLNYSQISVLRRWNNLIDEVRLTGLFTSGPKVNWTVNFTKLENFKSFGATPVITDKDGFIDTSLDIPNRTYLYKATATATYRGDDLELAPFDALSNTLDTIGDSLSIVLKTTDTSFYGCLLTTIFAEGFKEKSIVSTNISWSNKDGLFSLFDYYLELFEKSLGVFDFPEGINTNPYDVDVNPTAANKVSEINLSLTILIFCLRKIFTFLVGVKDIDINTKIYEKLTVEPEENTNPQLVGIELIDVDFINNIIDELFENSTKTIALGLTDFNGNEIPGSVRLGEDPNGDFSEESVKNQMNANAVAIFNIIETLYAYNNYEFNASVSDSVVNMHIALDAIKNIVNRNSKLTQAGYILPGASNNSDFDEAKTVELIASEKDLLDSSGNYSFTSFIAKESREIKLSGFVGVGPKAYWKISFEYLSGSKLQTKNFYTDEKGFLSEITILISDTVGAIRVVAEVDNDSNTSDNLPNAKDNLTKIEPKNGKKISGIIRLENNDTSKFFVLSQLSSIFSSFALDLTNFDSEESGYNIIYQDFIEKVGLTGYGLEDILNTNPYEASLNPKLTNKLIETNLLFEVLKNSLAVCLKNSEDNDIFDDFIEGQLEHCIYNVIENIDFSGNSIDLKNEDFIGDIIENFLIRNSKPTNFYDDVNNIKEKVSKFVSFVESNNTYDIVGGDVQISSFSLHSAFEALESNNYTTNDPSVSTLSIDSSNYEYPIIIKNGNTANFIEFKRAGKFSSGPKIDWKVDLEYLSGISIETKDLTGNDLKTDENGNVEDVSINIIDNTQCVKITAEAVSGSYDAISGPNIQDKLGSKISTILIPSDDEDIPFYASLLSTIFVSSIKNLKIIDKESLLSLKAEYEKKLGIDTNSGFENGMNTNPYDATLIPALSNKISSITLSLSALVISIGTLLNDDNITSALLNSIYDKIINHGSENDTIKISDFDTNFISQVITNISTTHSNISFEANYEFIGNIANCVSFIQDFNLFNSTGDLESGILNMHSAINILSNLDNNTIKNNNIRDILKQDIIADTNTYSFPYFFPEFDVSEEIVVNISGSVGIGPKASWAIKFLYLSGKEIDIIDSNHTETDQDGNISNIVLKLHPNTKVYKVICNFNIAQGSSDKLVGQTASPDSTPILSTILSINDTSFYASQISTLFVNSINSKFFLDENIYDQLKLEYETKLGLDPNSGFENGFNTNPFDITISGSLANKFSAIEMSLSALNAGLDKVFNNDQQSYVVNKSAFDNFVYKEIMKSQNSLIINNLYSNDFIKEIIDNLVDTDGSLSSDNIDSSGNSISISNIVSLIDTFNQLYSSTGGNTVLSLQTMMSVLEGIMTSFDVNNGVLEENNFSQKQTNIINRIKTIDFPYFEPTVQSINVLINVGFFSSGPKAYWKFSFCYLYGKLIDHNKSGTGGYSNYIFDRTSEEDGSIRNISFNILSSGNTNEPVLYKVKAIPTLGSAAQATSYDILTQKISIESNPPATPNGVIVYEEFPIIAILSSNMTEFYASVITTLFASSIKNVDSLTLDNYENLKNAYEKKLGIDSAPNGMNTNPYNVTINSDIANKLSLLILTLETLVFGINTIFRLDNNTQNIVSSDEIFNGIYDKIIDFQKESISINDLSLETTINDIIENIVQANPYITNKDATLTNLKTISPGISSCISFIERFSTFSNNGNLSESILQMHKALIGVISLLNESTDSNIFSNIEQLVNDLTNDLKLIGTDNFSFPYVTPEINEDTQYLDITINSITVGAGPKVNWKISFFYISDLAITQPNGDSTDLTTGIEGSVKNIELKLFENTEVFKIVAQCVDDTGFDNVTGSKSDIGETRTTIVGVHEGVTDFYISNISTLFSTSVSNLDPADSSAVAFERLQYEQKLGIDIDSGFPDGMYTNPFSSITLPSVAARINSFDISIGVLLKGLSSLFTDRSSESFFETDFEILIDANGNPLEKTTTTEKESSEDNARILGQKIVSVSKYDNIDGSFVTETLTETFINGAVEAQLVNDPTIFEPVIVERIRETISNNNDGSIVKLILLEVSEQIIIDPPLVLETETITFDNINNTTTTVTETRDSSGNVTIIKTIKDINGIIIKKETTQIDEDTSGNEIRTVITETINSDGTASIETSNEEIESDGSGNSVTIFRDSNGNEIKRITVDVEDSAKIITTTEIFDSSGNIISKVEETHEVFGLNEEVITTLTYDSELQIVSTKIETINTTEDENGNTTSTTKITKLYDGEASSGTIISHLQETSTITKDENDVVITNVLIVSLDDSGNPIDGTEISIVYFTKTDSDGNTVTESVTRNPDGSIVKIVTTILKDSEGNIIGSITKTINHKADGSIETVTVTIDSDGKAIFIVEKVTNNEDGTSTTVIETKNSAGKIIEIVTIEKDVTGVVTSTITITIGEDGSGNEIRTIVTETTNSDGTVSSETEESIKTVGKYIQAGAGSLTGKGGDQGIASLTIGAGGSGASNLNHMDGLVGNNQAQFNSNLDEGYVQRVILDFTFPVSAYIESYRIWALGASIAYDATENLNRLPRDWTIEGSNDGTTWTVLHNVSDYDSSGYEAIDSNIFDSNPSDARGSTSGVDSSGIVPGFAEFFIPSENCDFYTNYRLNITDNTGNANTGIFEIRLGELAYYGHDNSTTTETFDSNGNSTGTTVVTEETDNSGNSVTTTETFDSSGDSTGKTVVTEETDNSGNTTTTTETFDSSGDSTGTTVVSEETDNSGNSVTTTETFDSSGDSTGTTIVTEIIDSSGNIITETIVKDENDNIISNITKVVTISIDENGNVLTTTLTTNNLDDPPTTTIHSFFIGVDEDGNSITQTITINPDGSQSKVTTTFFKDSDGNIISSETETIKNNVDGSIETIKTKTNSEGISEVINFSITRSHSDETVTTTITSLNVPNEGDKTTIIQVKLGATTLTSETIIEFDDDLKTITNEIVNEDGTRILKTTTNILNNAGNIIGTQIETKTFNSENELIETVTESIENQIDGSVKRTKSITNSLGNIIFLSIEIITLDQVNNTTTTVSVITTNDSNGDLINISNKSKTTKDGIELSSSETETTTDDPNIGDTKVVTFTKNNDNTTIEIELITDSSGNSIQTTIKRDENGQIIETEIIVTNSDGSSTTTVKDADDNIVSFTSEDAVQENNDGSMSQQQTTETKDSSGNPIGRIEQIFKNDLNGNAIIITTEFDSSGNQIKKTIETEIINISDNTKTTVVEKVDLSGNIFEKISETEDSNGLLLSKVTETVNIDNSGNLTITTTTIVEEEFDTNGNIISSETKIIIISEHINGNLNIVTTQTDSSGNEISKITEIIIQDNPNIGDITTTTETFDSSGNVTTTTVTNKSDGSVIKTIDTEDLSGNNIRIVETLSQNFNGTTEINETIKLDSSGNLTGESTTVTIEKDILGNKIQTKTIIIEIGNDTDFGGAYGFAVMPGFPNHDVKKTTFITIDGSGNNIEDFFELEKIINLGDKNDEGESYSPGQTSSTDYIQILNNFPNLFSTIHVLVEGSLLPPYVSGDNLEDKTFITIISIDDAGNEERITLKEGEQIKVNTETNPDGNEVVTTVTTKTDFPDDGGRVETITTEIVEKNTPNFGDTTKTTIKEQLFYGGESQNILELTQLISKK